ncbi:MAG: helix-turn-helix domain-containing protein [Anaerocolumna sp.]
MDFSTRLRHLRQKFKLTQGELADVIGLKSTAVSNYEAKRNEPSFDKLAKLCQYFDVSCDYLLGLSDNSLRIGANELDKDTLELFFLYKRLNKANTTEFQNYARYLLYKQEKLSPNSIENNR